MRKLFLVLLAMTMVATMSFAQVQVEYDLSAEASATFGVNLDGAEVGTDKVEGPTTGFALDNNVDFSVTFVEETTEEFGEGDVYGWIEVDGFEFTADADGPEETAGAVSMTNGEISAKLFLGPAYIVIATAGNDVDQADAGLALEESMFGLGGVLATTDTGNSVAVGYDVPDLFNIEAVIASDSSVVSGTANDWSDNLYNNYRGAIYTETTVAGLTVSVDAVAALRTHVSDGDTDADGYNGSESAGDFGDNAFLGLGVEYAMPLNDMMDLEPYLGFDLYNDAAANAGDGMMDFEVVAGANVIWGEADQEVLAEASDESAPGAGVEVGFSKDNAAGADTFTDTLFFRAAFLEQGGDDGLLPVVGAIALVEYSSATTTTNDVEGDAVNKLGFLAELDADLGTLAPFFGLMWADSNLDADDDEGLGLNLGVDIMVIDATTFTVEYASGNLLNENDGIHDGNTYGAGDYYNTALDTTTGKAGTIAITTKIEY